MTYRDDREAAHARAAALERELAKTEAQLAAKEAELADKHEELEDKHEELQDAKAQLDVEQAKAAKAKLAAKPPSVVDSKHKLDALRRNKPTPRAEKPTTDPEARRIDAEKRTLRSVSALAETQFSFWLVFLFVPGIALCFFLQHKLGAPFALVGFAIMGVVSYVMIKGGTGWARTRVSSEELWASSLPFELTGYPELLGKRPRRSTLGMYGDDGHTTLTIRIEFGSSGPQDLTELLHGFDSELADTGKIAYERSSPVTLTHTTHGRSTSTEDHNRAVRKYVRRLTRDVLRPLHDVHSVKRVTLSLS